METTLTSPQVLIALAIGIFPSIFWLSIWIRTDRYKPEPFGLLLLCFVLGAISVLIASFFQNASKPFLHNPASRIAVWAGIEELLKFLIFFHVAYKSEYNDEAIDPAIYMIAVALGFAALENIFYALKPIGSFNITASLLSGGLRFFGSTLLHTIASAFVGISIGLSAKFSRGMGIILGLAGAIFLHASFNFFILKNDTATFLQIYGYLWVAAIISHLILEKLRRIPNTESLGTTL
jgi:protease PrsW